MKKDPGLKPRVFQTVAGSAHTHRSMTRGHCGANRPNQEAAADGVVVCGNWWFSGKSSCR